MPVMRDFLVGIGFQVDEPSAKRAVKRHAQVEALITKVHLGEIDKRVTAAELGAAKIATAMTAAAVGITTAVNRAAAGFERLNYISKRSGSTPGKVTAFSYAMSQVGSSTDEANGSLQEFGQKLKTFPGFAMALERLGVKARGANGQLRDTAEIATDLGDALRKMQQHGGAFGRATALAQARVFGWEGQAADSLMDPRLRGFEDSREAQMAATGADAGKATEAGVAFEQAMRKLQSVIEDIANAIQTSLAEKLTPALNALAGWAERNGLRVAKTIGEVIDYLTTLGTALAGSEALKDALKRVSDGFEVLAKALGTDDFKQYVSNSANEFARLERALGSIIDWIMAKLRWLGIGGSEVTPGAPGGAGGTGASGLGSTGGGGGSNAIGKALQNYNSGVVADELRKAGMPDEGIAATLGSSQTESTFNPRAHNDIGGGHDGLIQWDRVRWPKIKRWIESQPGGDPYDIRWQTRAFIAEGRAKPGDPLYDSAQTSAGFSALMNSRGDLNKANAGMRAIERYGPGEEGGREANARAWLPKVSLAGTAPKAAPPLQKSWDDWQKKLDERNAAASVKPLTSGPTTTNTTTKGDTNASVTNNITINSTGTAETALQSARSFASRGWADLLRNMQGSEQ